MLRMYHMVRNIDHTGNSGTGRVARVAHDPESHVTVVLWSAESNALRVTSDVIYATLDDMLLVHGHGGATVLEFYEPDANERAEIVERIDMAQTRIDLLLFAATGRTR